MGASMLAGPALLLVGNALHPVNHQTKESTWLAGIAAHRTQWYVAHLLIFIGLPLFVPAVVGVVRMVRERASVWAEAGAAVTVFGLLGTQAFVTVEGFVAWHMTAPGMDRAQMVALLARFNEQVETSITIGVATLLFDMGLALLALALLRERAVPTMLAGLFLVSRLLVATALLAGNASGEYEQAVIAAGDALLLLGLGGVGVLLLRCRATRPMGLGHGTGGDLGRRGSPAAHLPTG